MTKLSDQHLQIIGVDDDWETPKNLFEEACIKYNVNPRLDVAATEYNTKCNNYTTAHHNALNLCWHVLGESKDVFCNPPYTKVSEFVAKAYHEHVCHNITIMMLIFSKTDTKWWHQYIEGKAEVYNQKGRIKFYKNGQPVLNNDPNSKSFGKELSAPYPSCWIIWRAKN
jgi:site-specific DNA-methyltransferase (adenine-specific)